MVLKKRALDILYFVFLFDIFFIPPMHFHGILFKFSYYMVAFSLIIKAISFLMHRKIKMEKEILLLIMIALLIFLGWLNYIRLQENRNFEITFTYIIILFSGVGAYYLGFNFRFKKIYFTFPTIFLILNIFILLYLGSNTAFSNLYPVTENVNTLYRFRGSVSNPNGTAMLANIALIFVLIGIKHSDKNIKTLHLLRIYIFLFIPTFISVFIVQSRSGLMCFFLILLFFYFDKYNLKRNIKIKNIILIILILLFFYFTYTTFITVLNNTGLAQLNRIYSLQKGYNIRVKIIERSWDRILYTPILGSGADISDSKPFNRYHFHNDYLALWSAGGIVALILYLIFIYYIKNKELLLLPVFLFPGLTNCFLWNISAVIAILFLYSYSKNNLYHNNLKG